MTDVNKLHSALEIPADWVKWGILKQIKHCVYFAIKVRNKSAPVVIVSIIAIKNAKPRIIKFINYLVNKRSKL